MHSSDFFFLLEAKSSSSDINRIWSQLSSDSIFLLLILLLIIHHHYHLLVPLFSKTSLQVLPLFKEREVNSSIKQHQLLFYCYLWFYSPRFMCTSFRGSWSFYNYYDFFSSSAATLLLPSSQSEFKTWTTKQLKQNIGSSIQIE